MLVRRSRRAPSLVGVLLALACVLLAGAAPAGARIVRLDVEVVESPTFEGRSFGTAGTYEKLAGKAYGEVDPGDPRNRVITDLRLAPRNARGMVEYATDVWLVRPVDPAKASRRLFFEVNNRGSNLSFGQLNDAVSGGNDPRTAGDAGNGYLMEAGHTILQAGWDATAAPGAGRFTLTVPVARHSDGRSLTGPSLEEFVIDAPTSAPQAVTYRPGSRDETRAQLTWRLRYDDVPQPVAAADWAWADDGRSVSLQPAGQAFRVGLYELAYQARDSLVAGLGFAAIRDVASFLRGAERDDESAPNPLAGDVERVYSFGVSQPARTMHDFVRLGFNEDADAERVFDGVLNWIGGSTGIFMNHRFAQPFRTHRQHIGRWFPEFEFPFANQVLTDPFTGRRDGRLRRCLASGTCPRIMEVNSENEYWAKAMAGLHVDPLGRDLPDAPGVRAYHLASLPHSAGSGPAGAGICQQTRNPLVANPVLRGLLVALDEWVSDGREPPASSLPRRRDGTLARPHAAGEGAPVVEEVARVSHAVVGHAGDGREADRPLRDPLHGPARPARHALPRPRADHGRRRQRGGRCPGPGRGGPARHLHGLEPAPERRRLRRRRHVLPFARTAAEREASGDPRASLAERYPSQAAYVERVRAAADGLVAGRFLLPADAEAYVRRAEVTPVGG